MHTFISFFRIHTPFGLQIILQLKDLANFTNRFQHFDGIGLLERRRNEHIQF